MAVTPADLPAEFAAVPEATAQFWIDAAVGGIDLARWLCAGRDPDLGVMLKASHLMKEQGLGVGPKVPKGSIASEGRGGKSVSRVASSAASGPHGSSTYGQALDNILVVIGASPRRFLPPPPQPA